MEKFRREKRRMGRKDGIDERRMFEPMTDSNSTHSESEIGFYLISVQIWSEPSTDNATHKLAEVCSSSSSFLPLLTSIFCLSQTTHLKFTARVHHHRRTFGSCNRVCHLLYQLKPGASVRMDFYVRRVKSYFSPKLQLTIVETRMSIQSALIGFLISRLLPTPLTPQEIIVVQTTAVATGTMPLAAGFVGIIPALTLLNEDRDGVSPIRLTWLSAIAWSCGVAYFG